MSYDARQQSGQNWVASIYESRELARRAVFRAQQHCTRPWATTLEFGEEQRTMDHAQEALSEAHMGVLLFWGDVAPFADQVPDLWTEELATASIPKEGQEVRAKVDMYDQVQTDSFELEYRDQAIRLDGLDRDWQMKQVDYTVHINSDYRRESERRSKRIYLPPKGAALVYRQLNEVLRALNFAVEVDAIADRDQPVAPPEHVASTINNGEERPAERPDHSERRP